MPVEFDAFDIEGPVLFVPNRHRDKRGVFAETFRYDDFCEVVGEIDLVQENQSINVPINTIRGLHFQTSPYAQGKLIRVTQGAILDVAVDIRPRSATFGQHIKIELSAENWYQLWIPDGFAHGFKTLQPDTHVMYKASNYYSREHDRGIAGDDPDLGIDWRRYGQQSVISDKDRKQPRLADVRPEALGQMPPSYDLATVSLSRAKETGFGANPQ